MSALALEHRLFTVEEYHAMGEAGILLEDDRVELIDGQIIAMSPIGGPHIRLVNRVERFFASQLYAQEPPLAIVSVQNPVRLNRYNEPEPDVVLLHPETDDSEATPTPDDVLLLVEIAVSGLSYDRNIKLPRYAKAGIPEVWIVAAEDKQIEAYRQPVSGGYTVEHTFSIEDRVSVEALPELEALPVERLF